MFSINSRNTCVDNYPFLDFNKRRIPPQLNYRSIVNVHTSSVLVRDLLDTRSLDKSYFLRLCSNRVFGDQFVCRRKMKILGYTEDRT